MLTEWKLPFLRGSCEKQHSWQPSSCITSNFRSAREDLGTPRLGHYLEIAERLEGNRAKPEILDHPADLGGSC